MITDDSEYERQWFPTDSGATIGARGPEGGSVLRDEEFGDPDDTEDVDARVTLERDIAGLRIVAQLYGGWLYDVVAAPDPERAETLYETLKARLEKLADLIPLEDDRDIPARLAALNDAVARFRDE